MPFTAHDLRYQPEQSYPLLYAYLHRNAQRYLGAFKYDAFEVDTVIGHVVEQLVRLGLFGGCDRMPLTALDRLPLQFREVLLLVDVQEFSYKEASGILQVPIGTVMSRLSRARGLLRGQLTEVARSYGLSAANACS